MQHTVVAALIPIGPGECSEVRAESELYLATNAEELPVSRHDDGKSKFRVKVTVDRHDNHAEATARMRWRDVDLVGTGSADVDPDDHYPELVGEELAVARALTHLTRQLFVSTAGDIESVTGESVSVR
jgi:hypothetical protein